MGEHGKVEVTPAGLYPGPSQAALSALQDNAGFFERTFLVLYPLLNSGKMILGEAKAAGTVSALRPDVAAEILVAQASSITRVGTGSQGPQVRHFMSTFHPDMNASLPKESVSLD